MTTGTVNVGVSLEPLAAIIAHSCVANAWVVHEGPEMRVRALNDIGVGEEITICKGPGPENFRKHQNHLQRLLGMGQCQCWLCRIIRYEFGIAGGMAMGRENMKLIATEIVADVPDRFQEFEGTIMSMQEAGMGWDLFCMHHLHRLLVYGSMFGYMQEVQRADSAQCLKLCLEKRYVIEPAQYNPAPLSERINTFYHLVSFLNPEQLGQHSLAELPSCIKPFNLLVIMHLRAQLAADTTKCYGANSTVANFEKVWAESYRKVTMKALEGIRRKGGVDLWYEAGSVKERRLFTKSMNILLKWADIEAQSFEQLMA